MNEVSYDRRVYNSLLKMIAFTANNCISSQAWKEKTLNYQWQAAKKYEREIIRKERENDRRDS